MNVIEAANRFLMTGIRSPEVVAATADQVYRGKAGPNAMYPLVVFDVVDGNDEYVVGAVRLDTELLYSVRVVLRLPADDADAHDEIAALIDANLEGSSDANIIHCTREKPLSRSYTEDGVDYEERGGYYVLEVIPC